MLSAIAKQIKQLTNAPCKQCQRQSLNKHILHAMTDSLLNKEVQGRFYE